MQLQVYIITFGVQVLVLISMYLYLKQCWMGGTRLWSWGPAEFGWVARGFGAGGPRFWMAHKNKNSITLVLVWHKSVNTTSTTSTSYSPKGCEYDAMGPPCKPCTYNTDLYVYVYIYIHIHFGLRTPTLQPAILSNLHGCCKG